MRLKDILEILDNKKMEHYLLIIKVNNINTHIFYSHEIKKFLPLDITRPASSYPASHANHFIGLIILPNLTLLSVPLVCQIINLILELHQFFVCKSFILIYHIKQPLCRCDHSVKCILLTDLCWFFHCLFRFFNSN